MSTVETCSQVTPTYRGLPDFRQSPFEAKRDFRQSTPRDQIVINQTPGILYVDGSQYVNANAALDACPSSGCVIDLRGNTSGAALNLGNLDPGSKSVTLLLGPYTYSVGTITLETNFHIRGSGTNLQSVNASAPVFVLPPSSKNTPAIQVVLEDFQILGAAGNLSQDGFDLDCSDTTANGGLWYSRIQNVGVQGFNGVSIRLRGPNNGFNSNSQFDQFVGVTVFRGGSPSAGEALRLEGANSNISFYGSELDGTIEQAYKYTNSNIYLGIGPSGAPSSGSDRINGYPISIHFYGLISQNSKVAVALNGTVNVDFLNGHHEHIKTGGYLVTNGTFNLSILIERTHFAADGSYNNSGQGYLVKSTSGRQNQIVFTNNVFGQFGSAPDHILLGDAQWTACGNFGPSLAFQPCQFSGQSMQAANFQANAGTAQTPANISLGTGWGTGAKITDVRGWTQTQQFTINSGSGSFEGSPTISVTFPDTFSEAPLCDLLVQDVKGAGGSILFNPTLLTRQMAKFTAETFSGQPFVPAGNERYKVLLRCGP